MKAIFAKVAKAKTAKANRGEGKTYRPEFSTIGIKRMFTPSSERRRFVGM